MFFGLEDQGEKLQDVEFTVKINSIVEQNNAMEEKLNAHIKSAPWKDDDEENEQPLGSECLRKAKLSNQFGAVCLKGENFDKAKTLFEQAIKSFEQFKFLDRENKDFQRASFSNAWFNQANLFGA